MPRLQLEEGSSTVRLPELSNLRVVLAHWGLSPSPEETEYWTYRVHMGLPIPIYPCRSDCTRYESEAEARADITNEVKRQVGMKIAELQAILDYLEAP